MHIKLNFSKLLLPLMIIFLLLGTLVSATGNSAVAEQILPVPAEAHPESAPNMFDFDMGILVSQTINFFVLLFLLKRFLFVPIGEVIEERQRNLGRIKIAAEEEHRTALTLKKVYEDHLARIDDEIYAIKQQAILDANKLTEELAAEAHKRAEEIIEQGEMEVFMERQTAWAHIREEVVQLTLMAAEKVVEESLDDDMHHRLIQNTLKRLEEDLPDHKA
ncbi:MAG: F0F1 ATP synthase subunit B [Candidatus Riflebacteria bacterium]|nr:F0F1 ATP synthase subunit B [Candidatus Riflebacteria bacterium]